MKNSDIMQIVLLLAATVSSLVASFASMSTKFLIQSILKRLDNHDKQLQNKVDKDECRDFRQQICGKIDAVRRVNNG